MFKKLLIANRGEIACRIIKTARKLGIHTIAIYSTIDANALHTELANEAYEIGPAPSTDSYLNIDKIIAIARKTNAEAIHPGYGFLAENADFAQVCKNADIIFVGPSPTAIKIMGIKNLAKKTMQKVGVPVIPGYHDEEQNFKKLMQAAEKIIPPLIIKAVAGGGGKGMRRVDDLQDFSNALKSAKREAKSSFGNDAVFLEKYLPLARHVELQIIADSHGNIVHLFDRDCSIQRRHQKIIEEAPAPALSDILRQKMAATAVRATQAINYHGAGTIEFLVDEKENYYFMEMNTRLQVEHPVTEMITGIDLVEWQLRIAAGEKLPSQNEITAKGHSVEARICAENPFANFKPSTGRLIYFSLPSKGKNIRVDTGVRQNDTISIYYDPLIAKLIVWGNDRVAALKMLSQCLYQTFIIGVDTNVALLNRIIQNKDFIQARIHTHFIAEHQTELLARVPLTHTVIATASVAYLSQIKNKNREMADYSEDPFSPWYLSDGWRLDGNHHITIQFWFNEKNVVVIATPNEMQFQLTIGENKFSVKLVQQENFNYQMKIDGKLMHATVIFQENQLYVFIDAEQYHLWLQNPRLLQEQTSAESQLISPMPGRIVDILIKPQQNVHKGDKLMVIEAMKMEHTLIAPTDGVVKNIFYQAGETVNEGIELIEFEPLI